MTPTDLFGEEIQAPAPTVSGVPKRRKTVPRGYAAPPGSGPSGETCKTCAFKVTKRMGGRYLKCQLMRASWTGGPSTDIRAGSPACFFWRKQSTPCPACEGRGYRWDLPEDKHGRAPACTACRTTGVVIPNNKVTHGRAQP